VSESGSRIKVSAAGELAEDAVNQDGELTEARQLSTMLSEAREVLTGPGGYEEVLRRLAQLAVPALGDLCLVDVKEDNGRLRKVAAAYYGSAPRALKDELAVHFAPNEGSTHPASRAVATGTPSWGEINLREIAPDERYLAILMALGVRNHLTVPITAGGEVLGALTLLSSGRRYDEVDVALPQAMADQAGLALRWALAQDREHQLARALQARILQRRLPTVEGISAAARYVAGAGGEVGGDFYDMGVLPSGRIGFMVGDVMGHDAAAAVLMGQIRAAARALAGQVHEPTTLVEALQWSWPYLGFDRIATAVFCRIDVTSRVLSVASAGHVPPLLCDGSGARFLPVPPGPPLGVPGVAANPYETILQPDSLLVLYTDGLVESRAVPVEKGMVRLADAVGKMGPDDPEIICDLLIEALQSEGPLEDDVAVLALRLD